MQSSAPSVNDRKTIMICDDEQELLDLYSHVLERHYNIIKVCSGADCIRRYFEEKARGSAIDLLLLDYRLGDMFGDEVAKKVKETNSIKIILISAYEMDDDILNDLLCKRYIDNFLQKPIAMRQIIEEATRAIY